MGIKKISVTDQKSIDEIIAKADVCYMGMVEENDKPYVVAMNFGYRDRTFYFHTAKTGRKVEIWKKNPDVCLTLDILHALNKRHEHVACSYSMKYKSVMAFGKLEIVDDPELKREYLNLIMKQYTGRDDFNYNDPAVNNVLIAKVVCREMTAHNRGYF